MGDRTSIQVYVYDCPPVYQIAVRELLVDYWQLSPEWGSGDDEGSLSLDVEYCAHEISCGSASEIAGQLQELAPGASFVLWEDPKYEWLGTLCAYAPDLGAFEAECDANGNVCLTPRQVLDILKSDAVTAFADPADTDGPMLLKGVPEAIGRAMGQPWLDRWRAS